MRPDPASLWLDYLYQSWPIQVRRKIGCHDYLKLRRAQACLWRALNLYDDFLDGGGKAIDLPKANEYWRRFLAVHYRLKLPASHISRLENLCRRLALANRKETAREKLNIKNNKILLPEKWPSLPEPAKLSEKSLLLAAGPLALVSLAGMTKDVAGFLNFFSYSLSAKQLSDDACDWLDDLKAGKISLANQPVLKYLRSKGWGLDIKKEAHVLQLIFASEAAGGISKQILDLCAKARHQARALGWNQNHPLIKKTIYPLETAAKRALAFRRLIV